VAERFAIRHSESIHECCSERRPWRLATLDGFGARFERGRFGLSFHVLQHGGERLETARQRGTLLRLFSLENSERTPVGTLGFSWSPPLAVELART